MNVKRDLGNHWRTESHDLVRKSLTITELCMLFDFAVCARARHQAMQKNKAKLPPFLYTNRTTLKEFATFVGPNRLANTITVKDINDYNRKLRNGPLAAKIRNAKLNVVKELIRFAVCSDVLPWQDNLYNKIRKYTIYNG